MKLKNYLDNLFLGGSAGGEGGGVVFGAIFYTFTTLV